EPLLATGTGFVLLFAILYVLRSGYDARQLDGLLADIARVRDRDSAAEMERGDRGEPSAVDLFGRAKDVVAGPGGEDLNFRIVRLEEEWRAVAGQNLDKQRELLTALEKTVQEAGTRLGTFAQPSASAALSSLSGPAASIQPDEIRRQADGRPEVPAENSAY